MSRPERDGAPPAAGGGPAAGGPAAGGPAATLAAIRARAPLIHAITNYVAMDLTANLLLAVGASPVMVRSAEEAGDMAGAADALSINIGTSTEADIEVMATAARAAVDAGHPWVLDPVGVGATRFRGEAARRLAGLQPTVIRGNAAEIMALGGDEEGGARGLDSGVEAAEALDAAQSLAKASGSVVAVTGAVDYVTDGRRLLAVANGDPMMTRVTALGCALGALLAAALAVEEDAVEATAHGLAILGVAGEEAAALTAGPGSFRVRLLDLLYGLDGGLLDARATIR